MKFDIFFSICQADVDAYIPSERVMFQNFFDQVTLADSLGFETAWVAESHLSSEVQKQNANPVIPHFRGEVGLNTDVLQLAHKIFATTKKIEVGSAIRNILCNGGPLAHAESVRMFLSLHGLNANEQRRLHLGFAAGRFDYSNRPYGIVPRSEAEALAWAQVKPKIFLSAVEIFCRALRGDSFSSEEITKSTLGSDDFPNQELWDRFRSAHVDAKGAVQKDGSICLEPWWNFEKLAVVPREAPLELLSLIVGSHDPRAQIFANTFMPCKVFNLSITSQQTIDATHQRMQKHYHASGGPWQRHYLPRTVLVFVDENSTKARERAQKGMETYWRAIEGTLQPERISQAVDNALCGHPEEIVEQIRKRYDPDDRLMLWFDFNCHDNALVQASMRLFAEHVVPKI